ncbi:hypothetical protein Droror1_Dr00017136 [Drosera rotundifolia]
MDTVEFPTSTMPPTLESHDDVESSNGQLLRELEEISRALYVQNSSKKGSMRSGKKTHLPESKKSMMSKGEAKWMFQKGKMSLIWKWKPLRALSRTWQRRYTCCFFCHVHLIENLGSEFDGKSLVVNWKRKGKGKEKDIVMSTAVSSVVDGNAVFEETLMSRCSVSASSSAGESFVKYDSMPFVISVSIDGVSGGDVGKHWVDLSRLLPVTFEELEEENKSGKWATSFKLSGSAKGATLHVSFGFVLGKDKVVESCWDTKLPLIVNSKQNRVGVTDYVARLGNGNGRATHRRTASVPGGLGGGSPSSSECSDVRTLHEVFPNHSPESVGLKNSDGSASFHFDLEKSKSLDSKPVVWCDDIEGFPGNELDDAEFFLEEKGVELESSTEVPSKSKTSYPRHVDASMPKAIGAKHIPVSEKIVSDEKMESEKKDTHPVESAMGTLPQEPIHASTADLDLEEVDFDFLNLCTSENVLLKSSCGVESHFLEKHILTENELNHPAADKMERSRSLDDLTESVENDFLLLLEEHDPPAINVDGHHESRRTSLWWQFEKDVDVHETAPEFSFTAPSSSSFERPLKGINLSHVARKGKDDDDGVKKNATSETNAKVLERLETRSLMQKWGLDETAFQSSPRTSNGGFGSPIMLSPKRPVALPPLGDGIGSLLRLNKGGLLRSLSPTVLRNIMDGKLLIMQASAPVVLPAQMGSGILDILQNMALAGGEQLTKQLNDLMPLDKVSGKIIQQYAQEESREFGTERHYVSTDVSVNNLQDQGSSFVSCSLNDHTGSRCLSIHDLTPTALDAIEVLLIEGLRIQSGMSDEDAPSSNSITTNHEVSPTGVKNGDHSQQCEDLLSLSISLDEWMRLDDGVLGVEFDERTLNLLAAHHAYCASDKSLDATLHEFGMMGNHLTIASMMLLRDPLRNYEPVGAPMLALVQVLRVSGHIPPSEDGKAMEDSIQDEMEDEVKDGDIPRIKMEGIHLAGFNPEFVDRGMKSITRQQQRSASRWLLTNGVNKTKKLQFSKVNVTRKLAAQVTRNPESENLLWSISRDFRGIETEWEDAVAEVPFSRNPDVMFPN